MNKLTKITLAIAPLLLASASAFADNPAWYAGKYYDPDNPASPTGFTTGYKLYRTIGCPGRGLLDTPCSVPAPPPKPIPVAVVEPPPAIIEVTKTVEVVPEPPPAPTHVITPEKPLVLKDVNFRFNHYDLRPTAGPILNQAASDLKQLDYPKVQVDGFTDSIGTVKYNLWLSDMRAKTVKGYLVKQGVPADTLITEGFGKTHFVASNKTAAGRLENRRVELHIE